MRGGMRDWREMVRAVGMVVAGSTARRRLQDRPASAG